MVCRTAVKLVSRFRNSLYLISAAFEFRNRKDTSQPIDASVVLVSKFAKEADIGDIANFETTTLVDNEQTFKTHDPCQRG